MNVTNEGFRVRVCIKCLERVGTEYMEDAVFGCKDENNFYTCRVDNTLCPEYDRCIIRIVEPHKEDVKMGYCQKCTDTIINTKSA